VTAPFGHNGGPSMEAGVAWRRHCWGAARTALIPHLPIEVLRGRLKRAADLGLDYSAYASIRATTGRDVVAVLFSSNALRVLRAGQAAPPDRAARLATVAGAARLGLAVAPLSAPALLRSAPLDAAHAAPAALAPWGVARRALRAALGSTPADGAILVGDHGLEADWCAAAGLAGYLPADRYFAQT
jgi:hypothetical protein